MALSDLMVKIGADVRGFVLGMGKAKGELKTTSKTIKEAENKFYSLQQQLKRADFGSDKWRKLKTDIAAARTEMERMRHESGLANRQPQSGGAMSGLIGGAVAGMTAFAAAKVLELGQSAVNTQMEFEKLGVVLTNALGSSSEAQQALKDIQAFAAKTPFQVEELSESFLMLANRGMKPTMEQMRQMGDLAASQGKSFIQLTEAILDAATGEFERLKEFGIKGKKEGDKVTLMFKGQTVEVKNTQEAISDAIRAMGDYEGVAGGMAAISGTLSGKVSNLKDNWSLFLNSLQGLRKGSSVVVDGLNVMLKSLRDFSAGTVQIATNLDEIRLFSANGDNPFIRWQSGAEDVAEELAQVKRIGQEVLDVFAQQFTLQAPEIKGLPKPNARDRKMPTTIAGFEDAIKDLKEQAEAAEIGSDAYKKLSKELQTYESALKRINTRDKSHTKTAASEYRELQKELKGTREYLDYVGGSTEYVGEATGMIQKKMEDIFKIGGQEALKYAELLRAEMKALVDESRGGDHVTAGVGTRSAGVSVKAELPSGFNEQFTGGLKLTENLRKELGLISKEAAIFGDEYDEMGAKFNALQSAIFEGIKLGIPDGLLNPLIEQYKLLGLSMEEAAQKAQLVADGQAFMGVVAGATESAFANIASGAQNTGEAMRELGKTSIAAGLDMLKSYMLQAIGKQMADASKFGIVGLGIAGAAIAGLFGLVKGAMSKTKGVSLADGGIAYGRTMAEIGEYSGAGHNPEVIAPLDKLTSIMKNAMGGGGGMGEVRFEIAGDKLYGVLKNVERKMSKFQ